MDRLTKMRGRRVNLMARSASIALLSACAAFASAEAREYKAWLDIPAQSLEAALKEFGVETDSQVLFAKDIVAGRMSVQVKGVFTQREALAMLIQNTGLRVEESAERVFLIRSATAAEASVPQATAQAPASSQPTEPTEDPPKDKATKAEDKVEKVTVTGSRIKRGGAAAFPVNVYTRNDIDRSGQSSLGGFLGTLNEVPVVSPSGNEVRQGGQTSVQLRGLPVGTTLVLLNGRRVQAAGSSDSGYFNLDLIPFAAIERVEILPVGSSAIYGGDALGGVVNVVLRGSTNQDVLEVRHGVADGTDDSSVSLVFGREFERGSLMVLGSYSDRSELSARERDFFHDADYRRYGGVDRRTSTCDIGTVASTTASNLPGLPSTFAQIPPLASGQVPTPAIFAPTAGVTTRCGSATQGYGRALITALETASLFAAADFEVTNNLTVFGELLAADQTSSDRGISIGLSNVLVPETNAFNPFGVPIRVTRRLGTENGTTGNVLETTFVRPLVGLKGDWANDWYFEATLSRGQDDSTTTLKNSATVTNFDALTAALASSAPNTALNPFTNGLAAAESVLRGIWSDWVLEGEGSKDLFNAFVRGRPLNLPAGELDIVLGVEAGEDQWSSLDSRPDQPSLDLARDYKSVFAEIRAPLISSLSSEAGRDIAVLSLAGRYDEYSDFGSADTYQVGLELRPLDSLLVRYSAATSFKPPTLLQMGLTPRSFPTDFFFLTDPRRGNEPIVGGEIILGSNPDLQPESGEAQTIGIVWEPEFAPGLLMKLNGWRVDLTDTIQFPGGADFFLTNEDLFPGHVTRGPSSGGVPGPVTSILWSYVNFGELKVAGVDFDVQHEFETALGNLDLSAAVTRTTNYDVRLAPGAPLQDRRNKLFTEAWAPEWKGRIGAALDTGSWQFGVTGRCIGGYEDQDASTRKMGDTWFVDLSATWDLSPHFSGALEGATLSAVLVNATGEEPEYANNFNFYDFTQADWRGRYLSVRLTIAR